MKKYILLFVLFFALQSHAQTEKTVFELAPSQNMLMTGKGQGQDGAINPYKDGNSIAVVKNLGANTLSIRIQYKGEIKRTRDLAAGKAMMIPIPKEHEMYFDTEKKTTVQLEFRDGLN